MNLVQLTTVKNRLGITVSSDDTMLSNFIEQIGERFELEMNRKLERQTGWTQEFDARKWALTVERYPVEQVTAWKVKTNETEGFVSQTAPDFTLAKKPGIITLTASVGLGVHPQILQITYDGGFVLPGGTPTGGQTALPDAIEHAACEQVAHWYQNRHRLGLQTIPAEGRTYYQIADRDLLQGSLRVITLFKRTVIN